MDLCPVKRGKLQFVARLDEWQAGVWQIWDCCIGYRKVPLLLPISVAGAATNGFSLLEACFQGKAGWEEICRDIADL